MTRPIPAIPLTVDHMEFGDCLAIGNNQLMAVMAGGKVSETVSMAADLAEGMRSLLRHMSVATNAGELVFCAELKTLAFLSDTTHALTRAADLAMSRAAQEAKP